MTIPWLARILLFHWDNGLVLTKARLAVDFSRRQPRAFVSHAHSDHIARHEYALCTPETAALYKHRLGPRPTLPMPYRTPIEWGGLRLTTWPAGHCLGSAMLLAEDGEESLLYTGDFKLGESATAEHAELPHADTLIIESTYGHPDYRLPPRQQAIDELLTLVRAALADDAVPVVLAYALGKGQEVTRLLTAAGVPVVQHRSLFGVSQVYEACGVALGRFAQFTDKVEPGWARRAAQRRHVRAIRPAGPHRGDRLGRRPEEQISAPRRPCRAALGSRRLRRAVRGRGAGCAARRVLHAWTGELRRLPPRRRLRFPPARPTAAEAAVLTLVYSSPNTCVPSSFVIGDCISSV